jgi:hypothetical protein
MSMYDTLSFAALGLLVVITVWFGRSPAMRRARSASQGHPNMFWWASLWVAIVLTAIVANQLPEIL